MVGKLQTVVQVKNQAYNVLSANHGKQFKWHTHTVCVWCSSIIIIIPVVIIGRQQTTVDLSENPAYDPTTHPGMVGQPKSCMKTHDQRPTSIASSAGLRQLEHTYESLSPHYAHPYHKLSWKQNYYVIMKIGSCIKKPSLIKNNFCHYFVVDYSSLYNRLYTDAWTCTSVLFGHQERNL